MTKAGWSDMTEEQWGKLGSWLADISQSEIAQNAGWISVQQCEYVLRAFCDRAISRARSRAEEVGEIQCANPTKCGECLARMGQAFDKLRRELLGERL